MDATKTYIPVEVVLKYEHSLEVRVEEPVGSVSAGQSIAKSLITRDGSLPSQGIEVTHPSQDRAMLHTVFLAIAKLLHVALCPLRLFRYGEIEVGDIGLLPKGMLSIGALFRYDDHSTETQRAICGRLDVL